MKLCPHDSSVGLQTLYVGTVGTLTSILLFVLLVISPTTAPIFAPAAPLAKRSGPVDFIGLRDDLLARVANEPAKRTYNAMRAEDFLELGERAPHRRASAAIRGWRYRFPDQARR